MNLLKSNLFVKIATLVILIICLSSCKRPKPSSSVNTTTTIVLAPYLGTCDEFFENALRPITVTIDVDKLDANGNIKSNFKNYRKFVQNDESDPSNVEFHNITVPKSGTFAITVNASANVCYICCFGPSCPFDQGRPRFRGVYKNSNGVPNSISIQLNRVSCD